MEGFDTQDILASVIPGSIVVTTLLIINEDLESFLNSDSFLVLGAFIVASFITGEAFTRIVSHSGWTPPLFARTVVVVRMNSGHITDKELERWGISQSDSGRMQKWLDGLIEKLPLIDASIDDRVDMTHSKTRFWNIAKKKYGISDDFDDYPELYRMVSHSVEPLSSRTKRARRLYLFYRNLSVAIFAVFIAILFVLTEALAQSEAPLTSDLPIYILFILLFFIATLYIVAPLWNMARGAEQEFVNELMVEFYEQEHQQNTDNKNKSLSEFL